MRLLWAMVHALQKASKRMGAELGVTGPQRLVLRVVGLFPGVSAGRLAAILHVHPSTLTGVLQRLVRQRLLIRSADRADRRRAVLALTTRGARLNAANRRTVEARVGLALKRVGARDRAITRLVLEEITRHLDGPAAPARRTQRPPRA
ncbi:MAG: winged helix-turn-helix transcriptional regulator [Acidobacteria bacterium]|nr:winged helix-turn-helix transcriptional regulator [Acidobacteriota bacterium]